MLMPQFSTRFLLMATVGVAFVFLIISYGFQGYAPAAALSGIIFAMVATFVLYAILFGIVLGVSSTWSGRASASGSASPFKAAKVQPEAVRDASDSEVPIDAELTE